MAVFEPLQLIYVEDRLLLTAKVAVNADNASSLVSVYNIDYNNLKSELLGSQTISSGFAATSRTRSQVIFHADEAKSQSFAFDPSTQKASSSDVYKNMLAPSINDDFIFTDVAQYVEYLDLSKSSSQRTQVKGLDNSDETCRVSRPRESEVFNGDRDLNDVKLAIRCKDSFRIQTANGEPQLKTTDLSAVSHGDLLKGFVAADSAEQILMFDDLSLHYYQRNVRHWQREEALSQITQVEIVDPSLIQRTASLGSIDSEVAQMKQMHEPVSLVDIPGRIIQRRIENFQLFVNSVSSMFAKEDQDAGAAAAIDASKEKSDEYGFDKTLVFMTKPNKAVAISSLKGNLLWSRLIKDPVRRMVLEQADGDASLDLVTNKGMLIKIDPVTGAIRSTEALPDLPQAIEETEFIVAQGHLVGDESAHRQALIAVPKQGEGKIVSLKPDVKLASSPTGPSYFTQVKKAEGKIYGYRLNGETMQAENTWRIALDADQQVIKDVQTQYSSISAATKAESILPTVFGQEGELFYKFLDQALFAVTTANRADPSTLTVYLINGVTGRIVHQFKEADVSTSVQHKVCALFSEQFFTLSFMR